MTTDEAKLLCLGKKPMSQAEAERMARRRGLHVYRCTADATVEPHYHVTSNNQDARVWKSRRSIERRVRIR